MDSDIQELTRLVSITKEILVSKTIFKSDDDKYTLVWEKECRFSYTLPDNATFIKIYNTNSNLQMMIALSANSLSLGLSIESVNEKIRSFGFEIN